MPTMTETQLVLSRRHARRHFLASSTVGVASALVTTQAVAETLADVPPRDVGADLSGYAERSKFVHLSMLPEADRGTATPIQAMRLIRRRPLASWSGLSRPPICIMNGAILAIPI
jgi:sulfane dehydrogenase subunit SoxC